MTKDRLFEWIEDDRELLYDLADRIWETPELGLHEHESSRTLIEALEAEGFDVETGVGGMPTAFVATYGADSPHIGILGEFDALPGLSQAVSAERDPIESGAPGHGCGHNLFGTAGVAAAIAVKRAINADELEGTVEFYGCPAEETLVGKVFMARDGAFDDLDAAITWHPSDLSRPWMASSLALDSIRFEFEGVSAHAAAAPESGRSALDAVELLNAGTEYMREHIPDEARIHYVITDGGEAPNVVPETATVWYYVRAPTRSQVDRISEWLSEIADGAAMMTQTGVTERFLTGCYDYLPNETVTDVIWDNMRAVGPVDYDDADRAFAEKLQATIAGEKIDSQLELLPDELREEVHRHALYPDPIPAVDEGETTSGSTDVGDVSWITPTGQFRGSTWTVGTPPHTWQAVAANGGFGRKGLMFAAKVLAGTAYDLMTDPDALAAAHEEFEAATVERGYETPLPEDVEPPFDVTAD